MKKAASFILIVFLVSLASNTFAQDKFVTLGLKISPTLNFNRIESQVDTITINDSPNSAKFLFGLFTDINLSENYIFNTGVMYTSRKLVFSATGDSGTGYNEEFILDYIEIPITVKLLTNEFSIDTRAYAQIGFAFDVTVNQTAKINPELNPNKYSTGDSNFYFGVGVDKMLGTTTGIFLGIFYQRGLIDISGKNDLISAKNDILGLDFGVKF